MRAPTAIGVFAIFLASSPGIAEDPWADAVVSYTATDPVTGYTDTTAALGEPIGFSTSIPVNTHNSVNQVLSLGTPAGNPRGQLTVSFDTPIEDHADNPFGLDFIVYSNAFWVGGDPQKRFQEPAIVEISPDGTTWYMIPGSRNYSYSGGTVPIVNETNGGDNSSDPELLAGTITNPNSTDGNSSNDDIEYNWGYAELSPTMPAYLDNYLRPDDPGAVGMTARSGGGDSFDIAWAIDSSGSLANLTSITHIRITPFINRTMTVGLATPEIMAVADIAADIDSDGDGILDDYETRVISTDPSRAENTLIPLEIPATEGGSPAATLLGTAQALSGNALALYSTGDRVSDTLETIVDLTTPAPTAGTINGSASQLSEASLQIDSTVTDFLSEEVDSAEITIQYLPSQIQSLNEGSLEPYRFNAGTYDQTGITTIQKNAQGNSITFDSQFSGLFVLASTSGSGKSRAQNVWVDFNHNGIQTGAQATPYSAISESLLAVTNTGTLHLDAATTTEAILINQAVTLQSTGGTVRIGSAPPSDPMPLLGISESRDSGYVTIPIRDPKKEDKP